MNGITPIKSHINIIGITSIIVILVVIGIFIVWLYYRLPAPTLRTYEKGNFVTDIINTTPGYYTISLGTENITIAPGESKKYVLGLHEPIVARYYLKDGESIEFIMRPTISFEKLYLTEDGLGTPSNTFTDVEFRNSSDQDVYFVLVSDKGKRRFPTLVRERSSKPGNVIVVGQRWQIVSAGDQFNILDEIIISSKIKALKFDGSMIEVMI